MQSRRTFLAESLGVLGGAALAARVTGAQGTQQVQRDTGNLFVMDRDAGQSVRRPPKPNAKPSMDDKARDALEHRIHCQCHGCTLDVYTCRTTDFACQVSPAMHRDVVALIEGGYSAEEIIDAFVGVYGEAALMAPRARGFNIVGYVTPFVAFAIGGGVLVTLLRTWRARAATRQAAVVAPVPVSPARVDDEMARLDAAIRDDS